MIEMPVEVVTRVVEMPATVTRTVEKPPEGRDPAGCDGEPTPATTRVAPFGSASTSMSTQSPLGAIDGNPETVWSSGGLPVQWIEVAFDRLYLIDRFELLVAQTPPGETTHQIWISDAAGVLTKIHEFADLPTMDGQTLELSVDPPVTLNRVMIRRPRALATWLGAKSD